jgi:drug/metabolite transporter (DMT)-like permease
LKNTLLGGLALGILGATLFSGKAIIVKLAYRYGADPTSLIALRMIFAFPFFAYAAWVTSKGDFAWQKGDRLKVFMLGTIGYYAASYLDFLGLQYISAGLERIILYLSPTFVLLISVFWLKKKIGPPQMLALAICYAGLFFVFWHDLSLTGKNVPLGAALVLGSALCYAVYLTASGEMIKRFGAIRLTSWTSLVSTVWCIGQSLIFDPVALVNQTSQVYWLSVANGFFCTVLPVFLTMMAIQKIGSTSASQTGMVGPLATIFLAAWFLAEPINATQLIGTAVVMVGIFVLSRSKFEKN